MTNLETKLEREGNVCHIYKPEGTYTVVYGIHNQAQNPVDLPPGMDGIIIETWNLNYPADPIGCLEKVKTHQQYSPLFPVLEKSRIPIYFADASYKFKGSTVENAELFLGKIEFVAALSLGALCSFEQSVGKQILECVAATWLAMPYLADQCSHLQEKINPGKIIPSARRKILASLHPEYLFYEINLRNAILADKKEWLIREKITSHPVTVIGSGHSAIEHNIIHPQARKRYLQWTSPLARLVTRPETFYQIVRFDFNGKQWEHTNTYEVPELKELILR